MRYFSMFSGVGTGERGIEQAFADASPECVGYAEIDRHASAIYDYHYSHRNYGDATKLVPDTIPDFDFLIAGFPCQAFSIAGKRQGFDDARGTLFFEIARVLSHKRPAHILLENVGGLRSHNGGKTLQRILGVLSELGYFVELPLLNSKDYGVPQNRDRMFFIGHLAERCKREILSVGECGGEPFEQEDGEGYDIAHTITNGDKQRGSYVIASAEIIAKDGTPKNRSIASCKTGGGHSGGNHSDMDLIQLNNPTHSNNRVYDCSGLETTLNTAQGGNRQPFITAQRGRYTEGGTEQQYEPRFDGLTNTLTSVQKDNLVTMEIANCLTPDAYLTRGERKRDENGKAVLTSMHERRIRRLTPNECERLQGLPDDYTKLGRYGDQIKEVSDTQRYKCLGNAFTVNVIEAIVLRMLEVGCLETK
jgi:DNA (cytosine-5)-methyltransferase 1